MLRAEIEQVKTIVQQIVKDEIEKAISELKEQLKKATPIPVTNYVKGKKDEREVK